ncbi:uncharacterized protein RCC_07315 [Ramularia collo-cygni]|uniref:Uncharacterized protein n=1 Tax=Ramularia collo-cygni TaxID=112498 RepID=A0A2D3UUW8_9PEZI|nr:uncharacterized protein RCC_07315 [Ramularia collo-cygni]CZT21452.1 uncharacterized protein RCC_07315 [Ramularia collo-cygni]
MTHFFLMEPQQSSIYHTLGRPTRRTSSTSQVDPKRSNSMPSLEGSSSPTDTVASDTGSRHNSTTLRTFSHVPGTAAVERARPAPSDADIILVPVKLENKFRKSSIDGAEDLPGRPAPRSFFRRLSTRVAPGYDNAAAREEKYQIIKMPREDYKRFFQRDQNGNYAGEEEERTWDEEELNREFGAYQDAPLGSRV